ncbi:hypothetical protein AQ490_12345 [Wenjunlia vitaminophila]|uniref:Uncharacterized protein n=1 Tax=Wenjunlia vitaminophila TaxID=76728 RepID=A0A0T6LKN4_WENVI|nr:hypothetical protein AQ490_12345 [Wenjunlia vitaminophila]
MTASRAALTRDDLRVRISVQHVRLGGVEHRVIRPARPLRNGALYRSHSFYDMYVDRADGRRIATLFLLAARSPRSLVHLPTRAAPTAPDVGWLGEQPLDLVLAHRATQFPVTRWKRLRERLNAGNAPRELRTARVPLGDVPAGEESSGTPVDDHWRRDPLRQHVHARTLFLTGGTGAFREAARDLLDVTREGPPAAATRLYIPGSCNYHVCRLLHAWEDLDHGREQFHVEFCPTWAR